MRPNILLFGDSITERAFGFADVSVGWASLLAADYSRRADVLNRGYSGYNTNLALDVVPRVLGKLLFCTIFLGANDVNREGSPQHVPLSQFSKNMEFLVKDIRENNPPCPIVLISPPPVDEIALSEAFGDVLDEKRNDRAREYGLTVKAVAEAHNCLFLDTWTLMQGFSSGRSSFFSDGLHLNEKGNQAVYRGLMKLLQDEAPQLTPDSIPMDAKTWRELLEEE